MPPKGHASPWLGLNNRMAHCEDTHGELRRQIQTLKERLDAQQQTGDSENLFLNCRDCEIRIKRSAQVLEEFVAKACQKLDAQKSIIYQEQQDMRKSVAEHHARLQEELQQQRLECEHTITRMEDASRYCRRSLEEFHAVKDHLDHLADCCEHQATGTTAATGVSPNRVDRLQEQVTRMRKRLSKQAGDRIQDKIDHLQTPTHDLTSEVVAHESMLQDLRVNVADYQDLRVSSRALSAERGLIVTDSRRARSLSIAQRIRGAQRVAEMTHNTNDTVTLHTGEDRGRTSAPLSPRIESAGSASIANHRHLA